MNRGNWNKGFRGAPLQRREEAPRAAAIKDLNIDDFGDMDSEEDDSRGQERYSPVPFGFLRDDDEVKVCSPQKSRRSPVSTSRSEDPRNKSRGRDDRNFKPRSTGNFSSSLRSKSRDDFFPSQSGPSSSSRQMATNKSHTVRSSFSGNNAGSASSSRSHADKKRPTAQDASRINPFGNVAIFDELQPATSDPGPPFGNRVVTQSFPSSSSGHSTLPTSRQTVVNHTPQPFSKASTFQNPIQPFIQLNSANESNLHLLQAEMLAASRIHGGGFPPLHPTLSVDSATNVAASPYALPSSNFSNVVPGSTMTLSNSQIFSAESSFNALPQSHPDVVIINTGVPPPSIIGMTNPETKKPVPDGSGSHRYSPPDTNSFTFDPSVGLRFDHTTGLHYDANSGYFFNGKLKIFLRWDGFTQTYLRVENTTGLQIPQAFLSNSSMLGSVITNPNQPSMHHTGHMNTPESTIMGIPRQDYHHQQTSNPLFSNMVGVDNLPASLSSQLPSKEFGGSLVSHQFENPLNARNSASVLEERRHSYTHKVEPQAVVNPFPKKLPSVNASYNVNLVASAPEVLKSDSYGSHVTLSTHKGALSTGKDKPDTVVNSILNMKEILERSREHRIMNVQNKSEQGSSISGAKRPYGRNNNIGRGGVDDRNQLKKHRSKSPFVEHSQKPTIRSGSPVRRLSKSPLRRRSPPNRRSRSPVPRPSRNVDKKSSSPNNRRNKSPGQKRLSPQRRGHRSPGRRQNRSPIRSPRRKEHLSPSRRESKSPVRRGNLSAPRGSSPLNKRRNPSPVGRGRAIDPDKRMNQSPSNQTLRSPLDRATKSSCRVENRSPSRGRNRSPSLTTKYSQNLSPDRSRALIRKSRSPIKLSKSPPRKLVKPSQLNDRMEKSSYVHGHSPSPNRASPEAEKRDQSRRSSAKSDIAKKNKIMNQCRRREIKRVQTERNTVDEVKPSTSNGNSWEGDDERGGRENSRLASERKFVPNSSTISINFSPVKTADRSKSPILHEKLDKLKHLKAQAEMYSAMRLASSNTQPKASNDELYDFSEDGIDGVPVKMEYELFDVDPNDENDKAATEKSKSPQKVGGSGSFFRSDKVKSDQETKEQSKPSELNLPSLKKNHADAFKEESVMEELDYDDTSVGSSNVIPDGTTDTQMNTDFRSSEGQELSKSKESLAEQGTADGEWTVLDEVEDDEDDLNIGESINQKQSQKAITHRKSDSKNDSQSSSLAKSKKGNTERVLKSSEKSPVKSVRAKNEKGIISQGLSHSSKSSTSSNAALPAESELEMERQLLQCSQEAENKEVIMSESDDNKSNASSKAGVFSRLGSILSNEEYAESGGSDEGHDYAYGEEAVDLEDEEEPPMADLLKANQGGRCVMVAPVHHKPHKNELDNNNPGVIKALDKVLREDKADYQFIRTYATLGSGAPFNYAMVFFSSPHEAEKWHSKYYFAESDVSKMVLNYSIGRGVQNSSTSFLYISHGNWSCKFCKMSNFPVRGLCFKCCSAKTGNYSPVTPVDHPTRFIALCRLPLDIDEEWILSLFPNARHLNQAKITLVEDPSFKDFTGICVFEMKTLKQAKIFMDNIPECFRHVTYVNFFEKPLIKSFPRNMNSKKRRVVKVPHDPTQLDMWESENFDEHPEIFDDLDYTGEDLMDLQEDIEGPLDVGLHSRTVVRMGKMNPQDKSYKRPVNNRRVHRVSVDDEASGSEPAAERKHVKPSTSKNIQKRIPNKHKKPAQAPNNSNRSDLPSGSGQSSVEKRGARHHSKNPPDHDDDESQDPPRKPDGNQRHKYPPPDPSQFKYERRSGLDYDPQTSLYYDPESGYFYNDDLNIYLDYNKKTGRYVEVLHNP